MPGQGRLSSYLIVSPDSSILNLKSTKMKQGKVLVVLWVFGVFSFLSTPQVTVADIPPEPAGPSKAGPADLGEYLPGVELARSLSEVTGVAISPLMGVSGLGAWKYFRTPEAERGNLPWFCQPWAWGIGLAVIALCLLKDILGTGAPFILKKPFDVLEVFEDKLSAVVAGAAFVPFVVAQLSGYLQAGDPGSPPGAMQWDTAAPLTIAAIQVDARILLLPLFLTAFVLVWLSSHAINVLILLCPFGFIDSLLKLFKGVLLGSVVASAVIHPLFGAAVSLTYIGIAFLIAPWAFRLSVFGAVFGLDVLLPWLGRKKANHAEPHAFLAKKVNRVPARTYGRLCLHPESGRLQLSYRPLLLGPRKVVEVPAESITLSRGLLFPSLWCPKGAEDPRENMVVMMLPRYRGSEETVAAALSIREVRDSSLARGFKAIRNWLTGTVRGSLEQRPPDLPYSLPAE